MTDLTVEEHLSDELNWAIQHADDPAEDHEEWWCEPWTVSFG